MRLNKSLKSRLQRITDLCCCVNAFDSYCGEQSIEAMKRFQPVWDRQRGALCDCIHTQAQNLYNEVAPMTADKALMLLEKALADGGWEDNFYSVNKTGILKIEYRS